MFGLYSQGMFLYPFATVCMTLFLFDECETRVRLAVFESLCLSIFGRARGMKEVAECFELLLVGNDLLVIPTIRESGVAR